MVHVKKKKKIFKKKKGKETGVSSKKKKQSPAVEPSVMALGCVLPALCSVHLHANICHMEP